MQRILIVNRGEIAVRVARTVQRMGLTACTVYSDPDADALHAVSADEAYPLGGTTSLESYLQVDKILAIARERKIDAIHPGYGFLSENTGFARRCAEAGITFIGPSPEVIDAMGDKLNAKELVARHGVPTVPSFDPQGEPTPEQWRSEAERVGFPLLVKAAAGGGGKGMRRVDRPEELDEALAMARGEAAKAFGDGRVFLERYVLRPRHVEIQIFGDTHGNVVHLGERECSIQRRYQKVIEESPSPAVSHELRARMGEAACRAARALGYSNAGTVEFLLDERGEFFFLEVNTRLQVEHPVTECVYDLDLVELQLRVARGERLPFTQEELQPRGWAMECRLYAEDPDRNFMPSTGTLEVYEPPVAPGVRVDSGVRQGSVVSVYYDPMLAKLIAWGSSREQARQRLVWALRNFPVLGLTHNLPFLRKVLEHPEFIAGHTHTGFLAEHPLEKAGEPPEVARVAARSYSPRAASAGRAVEGRTSPFAEGGAWRLNGAKS